MTKREIRAAGRRKRIMDVVKILTRACDEGGVDSGAAEFRKMISGKPQESHIFRVAWSKVEEEATRIHCRKA